MAKHVTVSEEDIDTYITVSQKEKSIYRAQRKRYPNLGS